MRVVRIVCGVLATVLFLAGLACLLVGPHVLTLDVLPGKELQAWAWIGFGVCCIALPFFAVWMRGRED